VKLIVYGRRLRAGNMAAFRIENLKEEAAYYLTTDIGPHVICRSRSVS